MTEKDMQVLFGEILKNNPPKETEVYELKICKKSSLPFSAIKDHQLESLYLSEAAGLYHKLSDPPIFRGMRTRFNIKRPFDCFYLTHVKAFLVIWFYKRGEKKQFIKIKVKDFIDFKRRSIKKSLTEKEALAISSEIIVVYNKK
jgi:penicillin-binding protein-related factor A (putative recombinase)